MLGELHTSMHWLICMKGDQHVGRLYTVLLCDFVNGLVFQQGGVVGAQWGISRQDDSLSLTILDNIFLRTRTTDHAQQSILPKGKGSDIRVELNLIHCRYDASDFQQAFEELHGEIGNT